MCVIKMEQKNHETVILTDTHFTMQKCLLKALYFCLMRNCLCETLNFFVGCWYSLFVIWLSLLLLFFFCFITRRISRDTFDCILYSHIVLADCCVYDTGDWALVVPIMISTQSFQSFSIVTSSSAKVKESPTQTHTTIYI